MMLRLDRPTGLPSGNKSRWAGVDALKGLAILMVVIYHAGGVLDVPNRLHGEVGVDVFLLLSGLMLTIKSPDLPWKEFLWRRLFRIFPAYWLALAFFVWAGAMILRATFSWSNVLVHLVALHATVQGAYFSDINNSFWYLSTILALYLAFLVVRRWRQDAFLLLGIAGLIASVLALLPAPGFLDLAPRVTGFFIGMILGQLLGAGEVLVKPGYIFAVGVLSAAVLGWMRGLNFLFPFSALALTGSFLFFDQALRKHAIGRMALAPLQWIGIYSYEIYLFHQPLIREYNLWYLREFKGPEVAQTQVIAGIVAWFLVAVGLAVLVHHLVAWFDDRRGRPSRRRGAVILTLIAGVLAVTGIKGGPRLTEPTYALMAKFHRQFWGHLSGRNRFDGWSGPVQLEVRRPERVGAGYPLIVTGKTGVGDLLGWRRISENQVEFLADHWGRAATVSKPVELSKSPSHRIVISLGSLLPPASTGFYAQHPEYDPLTRRLFVQIDGATVFDEEMKFYDAEKNSATVGWNNIGASTTEVTFTRGVIEVGPIDPAELPAAGWLRR